MDKETLQGLLEKALASKTLPYRIIEERVNEYIEEYGMDMYIADYAHTFKKTYLE